MPVSRRSAGLFREWPDRRVGLNLVAFEGSAANVWPMAISVKTARNSGRSTASVERAVVYRGIK
jgi:hypothetical protein